MTKIKNTSYFPQPEYTSTDHIKFVGLIPDCALTGDCTIDETNLTYLLTLLLIRYCEENDIIDTDLSTVDLTCLITSNPDIEIPENITIETLAAFYKDHFCALYSKLSDLTGIVESLRGLTCLNDIAQTDEGQSVILDPTFNDILTGVTGTTDVTITVEPINGTAEVGVDNKITYTPNEDFNGNDTIEYTVTKGAYSCSARISIRVNEVLTDEDLDDSIITHITTILTSDEYWDIGIPIGAKMGISQLNLTSFDFSNPSTAGVGKPGKWSKWAIANGLNGTEDFTKSTLRGFDHTDSEYDTSALQGGSDQVTVTKDNVPPHVHKYDFFTSEYFGASAYLTAHGTNIGSDVTSSETGSGQLDDGDDSRNRTYVTNTGDGTENVSNELELKASPDPLDIRNDYKVIILVQKIA